MPKNVAAIEREAQRKARQAAALRANLLKRKAHKRQQSVIIDPASGTGPAISAPVAGPSKTREPGG